MATQATVPSQDSVSAEALLQFLRTCDQIAEQLQNGVTSLVVPGTAICPLGPWAILVLKQHLEEKINSSFAVSANAAANTVTITAVEPTPSPTPPDDQSAAALASSPTRKRKSAAKVPRPKNAFMIYRLDWHPQVASENPGMHNNDISKMIGAMWKAENQNTIDAYKAKAEEEKRQHAIAHPDYHYQPRKPSEKKKRMTKNKMAGSATNTTSSAASAGGKNHLATTIMPRQLDFYNEAFAAFEQAMLSEKQSITTAFTAGSQIAPATSPGVGVNPMGSVDALSLMHSSNPDYVTYGGLPKYDINVEQLRQEQLDMIDVLDFMSFGDVV